MTLLVKLPTDPERMPFDAFAVACLVEWWRQLAFNAWMLRELKAREARVAALMQDNDVWRLPARWLAPTPGAAPSTTNPEGRPHGGG